MFLSALVDAGANKNKIIEKVNLIKDEFPGSKLFHIGFDVVDSNGIRATKLSLGLEEDIKERDAIEMLRIIKNCCAKADISKKGSKFVTDSLLAIINAESLVHDLEPKHLHLHESGSIDTGIDLIGSAVALDDLGLLENTRFFISKVAVGGGFTEFSHGKVSNPTTAVLEILKTTKIPVVGGPVDSEITTPTGAAMLFGLKVESIRFYPEFIIDKVGSGTGTKVFKNVPNILRICIGNYPSMDGNFKDLVTVLETNIDDVSGEVAGYLIEKLCSFGDEVKDVTITNGITKKNRPAYILKVICTKNIEMKIINTIFLETGSLGIRRSISERFKLDRYILAVPVEVNNIKQTINIKISKDSRGNIISIKPEYEDLMVLAEKSNTSFRITQNIVNSQIFHRKFYDIKE